MKGASKIEHLESLNSGLQAQNNLHAKGPTARSIIPGSHQDDRRRTNGYQSFQGFLQEIQGLGQGGEDKRRDRPGLKNVLKRYVQYIFYIHCSIYHMFYIAIYMFLDPDGS